MASQASPLAIPVTSITGSSPSADPRLASSLAPNQVLSTLEFNANQPTREELIEKDIDVVLPFIEIDPDDAFEKLHIIIMRTNLETALDKIFRSRCYLGQAHGLSQQEDKIRLAE